MPKRIQEGKFMKLMSELSMGLRKICAKKRFLGFIDKDDLYQEALIKLWANFNSGALENKTASYTLRGCYFHIQNYIRTHKAQGNVVSLEEPVVSDEEGRLCVKDILKDEYQDTVGCLNRRLIVSKIMNNGLSQREKDVCGLLYEGWNIREVAAKIGISHVRVVKIKQRIGQKYAHYYKDDL